MVFMNEICLQSNRTTNIRWENKMNLLILKLVVFHRLKSRRLVYIRSKAIQMPNDILEAVCSCKEISGEADWTPPQKIIIIYLSIQKAF